MSMMYNTILTKHFTIYLQKNKLQSKGHETPLACRRAGRQDGRQGNCDMYNLSYDTYMTRNTSGSRV